jgi:hypothetical protein
VGNLLTLFRMTGVISKLPPGMDLLTPPSPRLLWPKAPQQQQQSPPMWLETMHPSRSSSSRSTDSHSGNPARVAATSSKDRTARRTALRWVLQLARSSGSAARCMVASAMASHTAAKLMVVMVWAALRATAPLQPAA